MAHHFGNRCGSTATGSLGSHGPGSSDDNRNSRRRLGTFPSPEDEHARSAVKLRFPCEQHHTGVTKRINNLWEESNIPTCYKPVRVHCKTCSLSVRLVLETRANCQNFLWPKTRMMVSPMRLIVHFATAEPISQSASPSHWKTKKSGNVLRWRVLSTTLLELFPEGDDAGAFIVAALDAHSQVLSIKDRRNGIGKPVFKLAPFGSTQLFTLVAPGLCVPGIPEGVLQQVISEASTANV